jgi:hypothetical protein
MYQIAVYIAIGNSDNKLTQLEWARFCEAVNAAVRGWSEKVRIHGEWYSNPNSEYQNACWSIVIYNQDTHDWLKNKLREIAFRYKQDTILWGVSDNGFLTAKEPRD